MRDDLKHLKWQLIKVRGLSEQEATERIENIIKSEKLALEKGVGESKKNVEDKKQ